MQLIGILGGTFNPIHFGHLRMAQELAENLNLSQVRFIPSANPPHKAQPGVSALQRADMVRLAIENNPLFSLDDRELKREGASYTIDTLISLQEEVGDQTALCLFMGSDAFMKLNTWHRWEALLDYCHIVLVQRPNTQQDKLAPELETLLHDHYTENTSDLASKTSGLITMQKISALDISSTKIRAYFKTGQQPRYLMPDNVISYIKHHQLYL